MNSLYPMLFEPVYKDYIWGGRGFERYLKSLPEGRIAERWDVSCHKNGLSIVRNGFLQGQALVELVTLYGRDMIGYNLHPKYLFKFPLMLKLIDANDNLSLQVHPDDRYAFKNERGEPGKNEAWHIISAEPGAKLILGIKEGIARKEFEESLENNSALECVNSVEVFEGDTFYIPAGTIHAIGKGILLAEIQQNSDLTYRVYDYERVDVSGNKRPLHIKKALDVISFDRSQVRKCTGIKYVNEDGNEITYLISSKYFATELLHIKDCYRQNTKNERFYIYTLLKGSCKINAGTHAITVQEGDSFFIPASVGAFSIEGKCHLMKNYIPFSELEVNEFLQSKGYSRDEILCNMVGMS